MENKNKIIKIFEEYSVELSPYQKKAQSIGANPNQLPNFVPLAYINKQFKPLVGKEYKSNKLYGYNTEEEARERIRKAKELEGWKDAEGFWIQVMFGDKIVDTIEIDEDINEENKSTGKTMQLYHGGRLDQSYEATKNQKQGRWEYGPGLYLTTHYGTAKGYAKGGRRLYKITIESGVDINEVDVEYEKIKEFAKSYLIKRKMKDVLERIESKWIKDGKVPLIVFLNLIINDEAIQGRYTGILREFLISCGADYHIVSNAFGWGEKMVVLFNMDKMVDKKIVKDETQDLPIEFS